MTTTSMQSSSRRQLVNIAVICALFFSGADALLVPRVKNTALRLSSEIAVDASGTSSKSSESGESSSPAATNKFVKPPRLIPEDPSLIPTLYNYDHCPFCVRVRLALGLKNIKHNLVFMANDDVHTPSSLVGKKIAPIMVRSILAVQYIDVYIDILFPLNNFIHAILYTKPTYLFCFHSLTFQSNHTTDH